MSTVATLKLVVLLAALGLAPDAGAVDGTAAAGPSRGMAADEPPASTDPESAAGTAEAAAAPGEAGDGAPSADEDPSGDVFVPTEEISEDYAVSFPVDI